MSTESESFENELARWKEKAEDLLHPCFIISIVEGEDTILIGFAMMDKGRQSDSAIQKISIQKQLLFIKTS